MESYLGIQWSDKLINYIKLLPSNKKEHILDSCGIFLVNTHRIETGESEINCGGLLRPLGMGTQSINCTSFTVTGDVRTTLGISILGAGISVLGNRRYLGPRWCEKDYEWKEFLEGGVSPDFWLHGSDSKPTSFVHAEGRSAGLLWGFSPVLPLLIFHLLVIFTRLCGSELKSLNTCSLLDPC